MQHIRLAEQSRLSRRTIVDALDVLATAAGFTTGDHAVIHVGPLKLPSEIIVGLVFVTFAVPRENKTYWVSLPTSAQFSAIQTRTSRRVRFDIVQLDGATVDSDGNVDPIGAEPFSAVEVIPARLPLEPSELDWRILHQALAKIRAEQSGYRSLGHGLPDRLWPMAPNLQYIDCNAFPVVGPQLFKVIAGHIQADYPPEETPPSQQQIADTLRKFGLRIPKLRPRKQRAALSP